MKRFNWEQDQITHMKVNLILRNIFTPDWICQ